MPGRYRSHGQHSMWCIKPGYQPNDCRGVPLAPPRRLETACVEGPGHALRGRYAEVLTELDDTETVSSTSPVPRSDNEIEEAYSNISFRVIYQTHSYLLPQLRDLIDNREILNLRPEYQRRLRWNRKKKSSLIVSLLLNIPVPPVFLYEADLARYEVMDGQQRLNAIHSYLLNDYKLSGLDKLSFLNGRVYRRLPPRLKRALDRASLNAVVLLHETKTDASDPFLVRRYVFERLNTGGQKLNNQEMRNSIFRGRFNDLIVGLARNNDFCEVMGIPPYTETDENEYYENPDRQQNALYKTMGDCQIVLRFFALQDDESISGSMNAILDRAMRRHLDATDEEIASLGADFVNALLAARAILGTNPFLLETDDGKRMRVSIALYDAVMGALYRRRNSLEKLMPQSAKVQEKVEALKRSNRQLLTGRANTSQAIKDRIGSIVKIIDELSK